MNSKKDKTELHDYTLLHYLWLRGRENAFKCVCPADFNLSSLPKLQ